MYENLSEILIIKPLIHLKKDHTLIKRNTQACGECGGQKKERQIN